MVLICGVSVDKRKLPYAGAIEYVIKARDIDVKMLAKTKLLQQATEIYATLDSVDYIDSHYRSKTFLIKDAPELIEKLYGQPQSDYMAQVESEQRKQKITKANKTTATKTVEKKMTYVDGTPVANDTDTFVMTDTDFEALLSEKDVELQNKETTILSLKEIIRSKEVLYEELMTEMEMYRASDLETQIQELESQLQLSNNENEALKEQVLEYQRTTQDNTEAMANMEMCETMLSEKDTEIHTLKETIATLEKQLEQAMVDISDRNTDSTSLNETVISLRTALASMEKQLDNTEQQLNVSQSKVAALESTVAEIDNIQYELNTTKQALTDKETEYQHLQNKLIQERNAYEQDKATYAEMLEDAENNRKSSHIADLLAPYVKYNAKNVEIPHFTVNECKELQSMNFDNMALVSFATGSTMYAGLSAIQEMLSTNADILLVDLTGDAWLPSILSLERKPALNNLTKDNIANLVIKKGTVEIIRTRAYNDVQLFDYDWVSVLRTLSEYANGRKTYILLGCISSFAVKYTLIKLSQVLNTTLLVKAEPYIVQNLFWNLLNVPAEKVTLGVFSYVNTVKPMLDKFVKQYKINVTKGTEVESVISFGAN